MDELNDPLKYIPKYFKVLSKADERGMSDLVPMVLWPSQKHYIQNKTHRNIVLKSRQTGASTGIMADDAFALFTQPYQREALITHDQETSEFLFQTIQRFYNNLPPNMQPERDWKSGSRMRFPKLDSYIYIDSAKSDSLGIGHTLNRAHLSEVAKWPPRKAEELFADISQTVPAGGFITVESTPKGRQGLFFRLYDAGKKGDINYKVFFYPWWWDITCLRTIANKLEYTKEEQLLVDTYELKSEQIAFRREKIAELGDLFFQEYPEDDIDCWLSSDISVVDGIILRQYFPLIKEGRQEGALTIWKDVVGGRKYVIGADIAAGKIKGDYSVASVLDTRTLEYAARLRGRIPPDLFAEQLYRLGGRYNEAEIAVERLGHGHSVLKVLLDKNYPNVYYHIDYDETLGRTASEPGWKTSLKTKPTMVTDLVAAMRAQDLISWSENLLVEAGGLLWEGEKKVYKAPSAFDDEWDAVSIAIQLREQTPILEEARAPIQIYAHM